MIFNGLMSSDLEVRAQAQADDIKKLERQGENIEKGLENLRKLREAVLMEKDKKHAYIEM